jgi:hypothetical protein
MAVEDPKIQAIYRYPVKGLSPEGLTSTKLAPYETLPADRLYAIENGPSGFDPAAPRYQPKQRYLMLMRNERLARLRARFEEGSHTLAIELEGQEAARGDLRTAAGRATIERFFAGFCADELRGAPRVLHAPGFSFSDVARKVVSIVNLASVTAVESLVGKAVHPLRFRANLYVTAGRPGASSNSSGGRSRSARMRNSRSSSASCAVPRSTSIPTPASVICRSRTR